MRLTIIILLMLICSGLPASAQRKARPKNVTSPYSNIKLDVTQKRLPPNYRGMDITQIVTTLEKRADAASKGEFETTAEYGQRIAALDRQPLVGSVTSNDLIAIEIPNLTASYDADNQTLNVEIRMETPFIGASIDLTQRYLKTNYAYHPSGTYIGSNALGMKRKIEKYQMWYYGLLIMNHAEFVKDEGGDKLKYAIALDRQSAIRAKPNLRALAIVRLYTPFLQKGYLRHEPTLSEPDDSLAVYHYLTSDLQELWLYDEETGQVFIKNISAFRDTRRSAYVVEAKPGASIEGEDKVCTLTVEQSPEIRGLKLGANLSQIKARYPSVSIHPPDAFGFQEAEVEAYDWAGADRKLTEGLDGIKIKLVDGRAVYLEITYDYTVKWNNTEEFTDQLTKSLSLPNAWSGGAKLPSSVYDSRSGGGLGSRRVMRCDGFWITAETWSSPTVQFEQLGWEKIIEARRKAKEEKRREEFKP